MAPKIFATGTTGYLGGTVLAHLLTLHPDWESNITCLVRSSSHSASLTKAYPTTKTVTGTLEDSKLLEDESSKADIVFHFASSDHVGAAEAIKVGLEKGIGGYWIHTSGTDVLLNPEILSGQKVEQGVKDVKVYDDWEGIQELTSFPEDRSHRPCDKVVLSTTSPHIKTAIICPPTIFATGRGPGNPRSMQVYNLASLTIERGRGILIPGHGEEKPKTFWPSVHVDDLARLYEKVTESAVVELEGGEGITSWGQDGYYFAENGVHYWQDVADQIAEEAHKQGFLESSEVSKLEENEGDLLKSVGPAIWNLGASCKYVRAKRLFGWEPREKVLKDEIAEIVRSEAVRAGIAKRG